MSIPLGRKSAMRKRPAPNGRSRARAAARRKAAHEVRTITVQVPDTRRPSFAAEVRRQLRRLRQAETERHELDFVEAVQADNPIED